MEFIFVETPEFKESKEDLKRVFKQLRNPIIVLKSLGMLLMFFMLYCGLLLVG